ncbi:hypothetical protein [Acidicapsa acidisoli]|uniref:hypothetical protein n=1 Tax=Acidicapsa acidisoli TaxID=1615681 RepID=UPI0021E0D244|nr:hypothetical protein [Acidicapsa acidisoli]
MTNPLAPNPETGIDSPEIHKHQVPIVNIDDTDQKTLEHEPPEKMEEDLLIFDEADALFGKRGGVKDSHHRY